MSQLSDLIPRSGVEGISWPAIPKSSEAIYLATFFQLQQSQWWDTDRLIRRQLGQLRQLLAHAHANVPYYADRLSPLAEVWNQELSLEDFRKIPILTRGDVLLAGNALGARRYPRSHGRAMTYSTSGSTGQPVKIRRTQVHAMLTSALVMRYHDWHQRDLGAANVSIRTARSDDTPSRVRLANWCPCYPTGPANVYDIATPTDTLLGFLLEDRPAYLQTHPSTLSELLRLSRTVGKSPTTLREVRTFGEVVTDDLREQTRDIWGVPLSDNYSAEEFGPIAMQCPQAEHYHVQAESVLLEVLDSDGHPCQPGEIGRVVISHLQNYATPLIRYELGDMAEVGSHCPCGRGLPVIRRIHGRVRNLVRLRDGRTIHPVFRESEILDAAPLTQYQLVQKSLDLVEIHYVAADELTPHQQTALCRYFDRSFDDHFKYRFIRHDIIPKSSNNKYELFRCEVET